VQLIDTASVRKPAREERLTRRLAERVGLRLLGRGGKRYADAVLEGLGDPGKAWMTCSTCKRPFVQEWAVREMGRAMNRALGNPDLADQLMRMLGTSLDVARAAVTLHQSVQGMDRVAIVEDARKLLVEEGWTVLPPESRVANGNGPSGPAEGVSGSG